MTDFEKQLLELVNDLKSDIESLHINKNATPNNIFIVFGTKVNNKRDNVTAIKTLVVPNIGEQLYFDKKHYRVIDKVISYQQVFNYTELDNPDRGGEMITLFVKEIY